MYWALILIGFGLQLLGQFSTTMIAAGGVVQLTRQHLGTLLVVLGSVLLALAVKVRSTRPPDQYPVHILGEIIPTEATIRPWLQWASLLLVALGSLLQW